MRVLHVGAAFAVEVQRAIPPEVDILDAVVLQVGIDHRAHAHLARHGFLILQIGAFLPDDLQGLLLRLLQQIVQIHDVPLAGGQRLPLVAHHAKRYVHQVVRPRVTHFAQHLEHLAEMQVLLVGHHI